MPQKSAAQLRKRKYKATPIRPAQAPNRRATLKQPQALEIGAT